MAAFLGMIIVACAVVAASAIQANSEAEAAATSGIEKSSSGADDGTCPSGASSCAPPADPQQQDHVLLQMRRAVVGTASQLEEEQALAVGTPGCPHLSVSRRRRYYEMSSCRRRYSTHGDGRHVDSSTSAWTCNEETNQMVCDETKAHNPQPFGYPATGDWKASGDWCSIQAPPSDWKLKDCPYSSDAPKTTIKVLTYNLYWWNLFGRKGGADRSAGKLVAWTGGSHGFDVIGFQECDSHHLIMDDARAEGLWGNWHSINGGRALAIAFNQDRWHLISHGSQDVCEDSRESNVYYGKRSVQWVRLLHRQDQKTVFFANHHGPLRVNWGGGCTGSACAMNLMRVIADNALDQDLVVLLGDFNAGAGSSRITELDRRLSRAYTGSIYGGIDHVYTNCARDAKNGENLGRGKGWAGSDHDALTLTLEW